MLNFTYDIPTIVHFGRGQVSHLSELAACGENVLVVYGGGSIKRTGVYDAVFAELEKAGLSAVELSGVAPNPRIESVREGVRLCREHAIDMVLAVGGGSVIDCAKVIAAGARYDGDPWDLVADFRKISDALPLFCVLTAAATGSEMDRIAVISDESAHQKVATFSRAMAPRMSVLDPTYTFSVPAAQTAAGAADILSHAIESYFTRVPGAFLQARLGEAVMKTVVAYAPRALKEPDDYEARANLMWASSLAINGILSNGAPAQWCVHAIEHELSAFYDLTHGVGLAILTPSWMDFVLRPETAAKFAEYGRGVFGIAGDDDAEVAKLAIACTRDFLARIGMPASLHEVGIDDADFDEIAKRAARGCSQGFVPLAEDDIKAILRASL